MSNVSRSVVGSRRTGRWIVGRLAVRRVRGPFLCGNRTWAGDLRSSTDGARSSAANTELVDVSPSRRAETMGGPVIGLFVLMALIWLIGTPVLLVYRALTGPYSLLEPQPLTAAQAQQTALFDWGLVTSLAVPVVGAILALYTRGTTGSVWVLRLSSWFRWCSGDSR
ncbi:MAG TPA: hypothetical protein VFW65_00005 [Pseudonocardiaceae bacterium]|nr:hypothetical protein [Pseudonocardiaceae bacterium]